MRMGVTSKSVFTPSAELLTWDSEFWSVRIGRANTLMDEWAMQNTVGCMWLLIPAHDQAGVHRAEAAGARVMDVRVKLERRPLGGFALATRMFTARDIDDMVAIARSAFRGLTRFYADPRFPDERCDDLYENWVRDSADGWAEEILVTEDATGLTGFVTIHLDETEASIGLIAVAERQRGKGTGLALTRSAVDWAQSCGLAKITVVTQGCNIPAQRTFQRAGFVTSQTDYWLHQWR